MRNLIAATAIVAVVSVTAANAAVVRLDEADFKPSAGLITFSEFTVGTVNPTYTPADYGGSAADGDPTVTTEGFFSGQSIASPCPFPGAAATGCVVGSPTGPLSLDPSAPNTFITSDGANPTSPVLSGSPTFNGPIALLFSEDQAAVGLSGGFFDAAAGTAITAFGRDGTELGSIMNMGTGIEFLGLADSNGDAVIAGLLFSLVGGEPAGFAIDNVRFGLAEDVDIPGGVIPLPIPAVLLATGLLGLAAVGRRKA